MSSDPFLLAKRCCGHVYLAPCGCCLHIRFARLFWRLNQKEFLAFRDCIAELNTPDGFVINEAEPGLALLALSSDRQAVLLNRGEIEAFDQLLEQSLIELTRRRLEADYQPEAA